MGLAPCRQASSRSPRAPDPVLIRDPLRGYGTYRISLHLLPSYTNTDTTGRPVWILAGSACLTAFKGRSSAQRRGGDVSYGTYPGVARNVIKTPQTVMLVCHCTALLANGRLGTVSSRDMRLSQVRAATGAGTGRGGGTAAPRAEPPAQRDRGCAGRVWNPPVSAYAGSSRAGISRVAQLAVSGEVTIPERRDRLCVTCRPGWRSMKRSRRSYCMALAYLFNRRIVSS